jgi:hypothetical protein
MHRDTGRLVVITESYNDMGVDGPPNVIQHNGADKHNVYFIHTKI